VATTRDIEQLCETMEAAHLQITTALEQLQLDVRIEDLESINFPFYLEKTWNELKQMNEQYDLERERLEEENFLLGRKMSDAETEQKELESTLPDEEETINLTEKIETYNRQSQTKESTDNKLKWEHIAIQKKKQSNIVFASSVLLAVLFASLSLSGLTSSSFYVVSLLVFTAGISQLIWQRKSIKSLGALFTTDNSLDTSVFITLEEKEDASRKLLEARKAEQTLQVLLEKKKTLEIQMLQHEEKEQSLQSKEARLTRQTKEQYEIYPFLQDINIIYWPELYQKLRHIQEMVQKHGKHKEDLAQLYHGREAVLEELVAFLKQYKLAFGKEDATSQFEILENLMETYHTNMSNIKQY